VAVGVRPNVLGVLVCPRGPDRLADALDPEFRFELVGTLRRVAQQDVLREVDVQPFDGVQPERDVAVHPHLADGNWHRLARDGRDDILDAVDCLRPAELVHCRVLGSAKENRFQSGRASPVASSLVRTPNN